LFGTAFDVARFGDAVRQSATPGSGTRLFGTPTAARALVPQTGPEVAGGPHTLLFFARNNPLCPAGDLLSPQAVGHSGFTGTLLSLDPAYDLTVALLTNRVFADPENGAAWLLARRRFLNALAAALI
jgi:CubicO group peptidase (beta-lactamase class C family)